MQSYCIKGPSVCLDFNALLQGYFVDAVADFLKSKKSPPLLLNSVVKFMLMAKNQMERIRMLNRNSD